MHNEYRRGPPTHVVHKEEQIHFYFDHALRKTSEEYFMELWKQKCSLMMCPPPTVIEYQKYMCKDWREMHWKTSDHWKQDILECLKDILCMGKPQIIGNVVYWNA